MLRIIIKLVKLHFSTAHEKVWNANPSYAIKYKMFFFHISSESFPHIQMWLFVCCQPNAMLIYSWTLAFPKVSEVPAWKNCRANSTSWKINFHFSRFWLIKCIIPQHCMPRSTFNSTSTKILCSNFSFSNSFCTKNYIE